MKPEKLMAQLEPPESLVESLSDNPDQTDDAAIDTMIRQAMTMFKPPEKLTVSEWADKYRRLSPESSAEAGPWRTSRTPYLKEVMDSFSDSRVRRITMVAGSQIGKSECLLNCIGYTIHQDPGSTLFAQPTIDDAKKFSRLRIMPMIRDTPVLAEKMRAITGKKQAKTVMSMGYPGGMLTMVGTQAASALASTPARYIFGDERDRWAASAGKEGDPWKLAEARQTTFYNAKSIEVSTPTTKGASNIELGFNQGTQEHWCHQCPECGEYSEIEFDAICFNRVKTKVKGKNVYSLEGPVRWCCPKCHAESTEAVMRKQPAKWIADNPDAFTKKGHRSFWLNAFSSPWTPWSKICLDFLEAKDDPQRLQVVYNTLLGKLWEDRGGVMDEDELMQRRESYGIRPDGSMIELPDGILVLTCGIDTQDDRFEYEVVGHGFWGETWGIEKGTILGRPDTAEPWARIDQLLSHVFRFENGRGLTISLSCIDSGGHYTQEVYEQVRLRQAKRLFAIKGHGGEGVPFIPSYPTKIAIRGDKSRTVALFSIGVDAGKAQIMSDLKVQSPGPKFCHFPTDPTAGYDENYFNGLLSEKLVLTGRVWKWEKIAGHIRNEPLDCRNYALAAFRILNPDLEAVQKRLVEAMKAPMVKQEPKEPPKRRTRRNKMKEYYDEW